MLVPFQKETLQQQRFIRDEVQFALLHTISEGELAVALQAEDGGAVALGNPGLNIWLCIDKSQGGGYASRVIEELADRLNGSRLPGFVSAPEHAEPFSETYCRGAVASGRRGKRLAAYSCPAVIMPSGVSGHAVKAAEEDLDTVADFSLGFIRDCFGEAESRENALKSAGKKILSGGLYLWQMDGRAVCMASVSHRSPRLARIGYVYTPPAERAKGYASALTAALSRMVLGEGLTPVLYADMENPHSNKVYRGIGFIEAGEVDEYRFIYD
jgi:GNAT superfamily N-acetyltransferase